MLKKTALSLVLLLLSFGVMMVTTRDATFAVEESRILEARSPAIWGVLTDVDTWPEWWPGIEAAELTPEWAEGAELGLVLEGRSEKTPATVELYRQGRQLSWIRPGVLGSTSRTLLRVEQAADGVVVSMESSLQGPQAFLARFTGEESFRKYQRLVLRSLQGCLAGKAQGADSDKGA